MDLTVYEKRKRYLGILSRSDTDQSTMNRQIVHTMTRILSRPYDLLELFHKALNYLAASLLAPIYQLSSRQTLSSN